MSKRLAPTLTLAALLAVLLAAKPAAAAESAAPADPAAAPPPAAAVQTSTPPAPPTSPAPEDSAAPGGAPPSVIDSDAIFLWAERLERDGENRVVVGEGAVTIRHRDMRLVADRVLYHELSKDVVAEGNVVLDSGRDRLQGEHLELNLETRVGFMEKAQGFLQTYYITGERLEKRGPDHYFIRRGSFTTCEGVLPDWSFHATSTELTIDEYLHAWNPTLRVKKLPILYFPYAVFPIKRERSTGLLIPEVTITSADGFGIRNAFYWAPRDNFDATIGIDYLQKTGWGAGAETRYLLAPRTQGIVTAYYERNTDTDAERWALQTRNSQALPLGFHAEIDAFFQSDREFISTKGKTMEERSNERTTASFYINRSWSAWNFTLSGRNEVSLITEKRTTITRFPELVIDRTSTRLFGTNLFLKLAASGVMLERDDSTTKIETTRLHLAPEMSWPLSLSGVARVIPSAGYAWTSYSENTEGVEETREVPFFKIALEGPRPYRIWDLSGDGRFTKLKHLVEPRVLYVYTPEVDQDTIPQFDSIDRIPQANRLEYSLINTLFAKVRSGSLPVPAPAAAEAPGAGSAPISSRLAGLAAAPVPGDPAAAAPPTTTQELLWIKLSQNYTINAGSTTAADHSFSPVEWEVRTRPSTGLEVLWRGNFDTSGNGIGYQNLSLAWRGSGLSVHGDWRSSRDSNQDFLDLGGTATLGRFDVLARSRYNITDGEFVENRINLKYVSQCWDVALGFVRWTSDYEYSLTFSLKGIGTIVKI